MAPASVISRERILTVARSLPAAPQAMAGLCELMQDINADLGEISDQIAIDSALAARIIRISNSVIYGGGGLVGSVDEAVGRVGFGEILRLVGAATVANLVDRNLAGYGVPAELLRESLLMHALASEALARYTDLDARRAYTAGLLRAVGMMVMARIEAAAGGTPTLYDPNRHPTYADWEGERFGISGTEVAAIVFIEWRFPNPMVRALRGHAFTGPTPKSDDVFSVLLNLAGGIVTEAGLALPGEKAFWTPSPEKFAVLGIEEAQWRDAGLQAQAQFNRLAQALK